MRPGGASWTCERTGSSAALIVAATVGLAPLPVSAEPTEEPQSNTVLGANLFLSDGAAALMSGDWERGIQLTQMGLNTVLSTPDRAAGLANLCAGYVALKKYERALENCDQSLALSQTTTSASPLNLPNDLQLQFVCI